jgi:hypothetical protein
MKNNWIWIVIALVLAIGLDLWLMPKLWQAGKRLKNWRPNLPKIPRLKIKSDTVDEYPQVEEKLAPVPTIIATESVDTDAPRPEPAQPPIRLSLSLPPGAHLAISLRVTDGKDEEKAD